LAVLLVVFSHAHVPLFAPGGIVGVTLFFTLSGFLISGLLLREYDEHGRIDLPAFWGRRALRLLPALYVFLTVISGLWLLFGWSSSPRSMVRAVLPVVGYIGNLTLATGGTIGPFRHTWSLAIEEQFYLVWPLLLLGLLTVLGRRRRRTVWLLSVLVALTVASASWRVWDGVAQGHLHLEAGLWPWATVFSMTAGAALAVVYRAGWRPGRGAGAVSLIALVVLLAGEALFDPYVALVDAYWGGWIWGPLWYTGIGVVLIASVSGSGWSPFLFRPLRGLGTISYGWYLWHLPFVPYVERLSGRWLPHLAMAGVVVGSLLVAVASWRLVERPLQRRFRHRLERARLTDAPGSREPAPAPDPGADPGIGPGTDSDVDSPAEPGALPSGAAAALGRTSAAGPVIEVTG
jgi:peptidoglycan/LPS O-acetylase OafA/YrhL